MFKRDTLKTRLISFVERETNFPKSRVDVLREMMNILTDELYSEAKKPSPEFSFLSKRSLADESLADYGSEGRRTPKRCFLEEPASPVNERYIPSKVETADDLVAFRNDTKAAFERMRLTSNFKTNDPAEKQIIKAHTISASDLSRFPVGSLASETKGVDLDKVKRVLKSVQSLSKEPNESERRCLQHLKTVAKGFTSNAATFLRGSVSGTPDAVLIRDGEIVEVAEFKTSKSTNPKSLAVQLRAARLQVQTYLYILDLREGYLVVEDQKNGIRHEVVRSDPQFSVALAARKANFNGAFARFK